MERMTTSAVTALLAAILGLGSMALAQETQAPDARPAPTMPMPMPGQGPEAQPGPGRPMSSDGMRAMHDMMHGNAQSQGGAIAGMMSMCPMMGGQTHRMHMGGELAMPTMDEAAILYGMGGDAPEEMTGDRVREFLERLLERHGNPRLTIGTIEDGEDGTIVAEITTVDGSVVQRLAFNRYPWPFRQIE